VGWGSVVNIDNVAIGWRPVLQWSESKSLRFTEGHVARFQAYFLSDRNPMIEPLGGWTAPMFPSDPVSVSIQLLVGLCYIVIMTSKTVDSDHPQTQPQKSPRSYLALKDDPDPRSRVLDPPIMIRTSLLGKPSPTPRKKPKQHSRHVLSNEFNGGDVQSASDFGKDPNNV
jgi:hypothetical protein